MLGTYFCELEKVEDLGQGYKVKTSSQFSVSGTRSYVAQGLRWDPEGSGGLWRVPAKSRLVPSRDSLFVFWHLFMRQLWKDLFFCSQEEHRYSVVVKENSSVALKMYSVQRVWGAFLFCSSEPARYSVGLRNSCHSVALRRLLFCSSEDLFFCRSEEPLYFLALKVLFCRSEDSCSSLALRTLLFFLLSFEEGVIL